MRWRSRTDRRTERGAAAVEFALVVPLLLLIVGGIIAYGLVFAQTLSLSNSARQAARSGVIEGTTCTQIGNLANDAADTIGMDGADAVVTIKRGPSEAAATTTCAVGADEPCAGQPETTNLYVLMRYDTEPVMPLVPVPDQLSGKGVFRCEFS